MVDPVAIVKAIVLLCTKAYDLRTSVEQFDEHCKKLVDECKLTESLLDGKFNSYCAR